MMQLPHTTHYRRYVSLLLAVCVCFACLAGADAAPGMEEHADTRGHFVHLDGEIQAIKEEILEINRDILLLEESSLYPQGQQLVVLVSVAGKEPVNPDSISLLLDGHTVNHHIYTSSEAAALREGGVHRLYTGRLSDGKHLLEVSVTGKQAGGNVFREQRSIAFNKSPGRKYLELHLRPAGDTTDAGLTIREW